MSQPFFTVIIPNFNMGEFVSLSIKSVLEQTFNDFEIIVVDNASTDSSWDEIDKFENFKIRKYKQVVNLGMYANLNVGIMLAKGKYIKIQCSDDILHPQCLEILNKIILSNEAQTDKPLYISHKMAVGKPGENYTNEWHTNNFLHDFSYKESKLMDEIQTGLPNVCIDTLSFQKFGGFGVPNIQKDFSRDLLRLGLFSQLCKCFETKLPLVFERSHSGQSRYSLKKQWQLNEIYELYNTSGIINTEIGKEKIKILAGMHLASAIKFLIERRDFSYLIHTLGFSMKKKLLGTIYLKSFISRVKSRSNLQKIVN